MLTLQSLYENGKLPHAVLFSGVSEVSSVSEDVLSLYNSDPADTVRVKELMPDGVYKIVPLRAVVDNGNLRPQFGDVRVFVFNEFDTMSEKCQNTLLKFIEEPHEFNRFVMSAVSTGNILTTILSRVVVIRQDFIADKSDSDADVTAKAIIDALARKSEYDMAAAFCRVKDRRALSDVFERLLHRFGIIMRTAKNPSKVIAAADVVQKYAARSDVNPNIQITAASCAAEIYTVML